MGENPLKAFNNMLKDGEYGEGYTALKLSLQWLKDAGPDFLNGLILLQTLYEIIFQNGNPEKKLKEFVTKIGF